MSRVREVLKNKNLIEKSQRARRKEELQNINYRTSYRAALTDNLAKISKLLDSIEVDYLVIEVPEKMLPQFSEAIYSDELSEYDITQITGKPNEFMIKYKLI